MEAMKWDGWLFCTCAFVGCGTASAPPVDAVEVPAVGSTAEAVAPNASALRRGQTDSGIVWRELARGSGRDHPQLNDEVEVLYTGFKKAGGRFDGTDGTPARFNVARVIPAWTEILQMMVAGDRWRIEVPAALAYGDEPEVRGAPAGDLVFELELVRIHPAPPVPDDVAEAPALATRTGSGLAYVTLSEGEGTRHPGGIDKVLVHYTGWTADGKMFDSTIVRGEPARLQVNAVIEGFAEMLGLMVEGDEVRVWIPPDLGYGVEPKPGRPHGLLVYEIELIEVE